MYCIRNIQHVTKMAHYKTHCPENSDSSLTVYIINHVICLVMSASQYKTQTDQVLYCLFCCNDRPAVHYNSNYGYLPSKKKDIMEK